MAVSSDQEWFQDPGCRASGPVGEQPHPRHPIAAAALGAPRSGAKSAGRQGRRGRAPALRHPPVERAERGEESSPGSSAGVKVIGCFPMKTSLLRFFAVVLLALSAAVPASGAGDKILHLAIGDPARKDREAPLVLDAVTDTRSGETVALAALVDRLSSTRLLLIGEEHTNTESHAVQLRVLRALAESGRRVLIGLEMYPYTEQRYLDQWRDGLLTEEGFLQLSRWYGNWGYNWQYYRDIFLLARDRRLSMFAVNTPREVVAAVREKGLANLTPEEAAHVPPEIDVDNANHMTFFRTTFEEDQGPVHGAGMGDAMWKRMLSAQCTWDATMGFNAVRALRQTGDPKAIMVVLVGSGHVAYGLGIERQARKWFDGPTASLIPVAVSMAGAGPIASVRASYADFIWGVPEQADSAYPTLGTSTAVGEGDVARKVIIVQKNSPADRAGIKVGDVLESIDGTPLADKETLARLIAAKRWGDTADVVLRRGDRPLTVTVAFRRTARRADETAAPRSPR